MPYGYVLNRTVDANNVQTSTSDFGLDDIQAGLSRQMAVEHGRVPDSLASFHFKSVTGTDSYDLQSSETSLGTGFNSLEGTLTAAKSSDPVVFFGSLSYVKSLPAHHTIPVNDPATPGVTSRLAYFRPGDAFGFQLGSILALTRRHRYGWVGPALYTRDQNGRRSDTCVFSRGRFASPRDFLHVCSGTDCRPELRGRPDSGHTESAVFSRVSVQEDAVEAVVKLALPDPRHLDSRHLLPYGRLSRSL